MSLALVMHVRHARALGIYLFTLTHEGKEPPYDQEETIPRPQLPASQGLVPIACRVRPYQFELLQRLSRATGLSMSDRLRRILEMDRPRLPEHLRVVEYDPDTGDPNEIVTDLLPLCAVELDYAESGRLPLWEKS